jgi:hypothetical protein
MGNMAYRTGETIFWDAGANKFKQKEANALMKPDYKNGWKLPKV